jgi:hypothetical protein
LWLCWCVGTRNFKNSGFWVFKILVCGGNNSQLHDLCGCVDVWRLLALINFLWLCQCLKLLFCLVVLIWGRTNEDVLVASCRNDMTPKKIPLGGHEILCANGNEKNHSLLCLGHLIRTCEMISRVNITL